MRIKRVNRREQLIVWLTDAYAMEVATIGTLQKHADDAGDFPEVQSGIIKHLLETENHAVTVRLCLESLEAKPSPLKTGFAKVTTLIGEMPTSLAYDTVIKNSIFEFSNEQMEIASYAALVDAAQMLRLPEIATACRKILAEERARARVLARQLRKVSRQYLRSLDDWRPVIFAPPAPAASPRRTRARRPAK